MGYFLREIRESLDITLEALFKYDLNTLGKQRRKVKQVQDWANILMANIFKTLRLLQKGDVGASFKYAQTIRRLQKLSDGHRDMVLRAYVHVSNNHKGLLPIQIEQLQEMKKNLLETFMEVESVFEKQDTEDISFVVLKHKELRRLGDTLNTDKIERICTRESKTRLSILFYAVAGNAIMLSKQNLRLLEIFQESFQSRKLNGSRNGGKENEKSKVIDSTVFIPEKSPPPDKTHPV